MRSCFFLLLIFCLLAPASRAQVETTQYFMTSLPQVVEGNPAFMPKYSFALGLPMSRVAVMYSNDGFSYNDITRVENDKRVLDVEKWQAMLPEKTHTMTAMQADIFRLGLKIGSGGYLSMHSTVRAYTHSMMPKDLVSLITEGTAPYVGKTANISPTMFGVSFWESGIGFSGAITDKMRVGVRLKKLYGLVNLTTEAADVSVSIDDNYAIDVAADLRVRSSGVNGLSNDADFRVSDKMENSGWAGDFGITWRVLPRINLAASLVDIGGIKWDNDVYDYTLDKATAKYRFGGFDAKDLLNGDTSLEDDLDSLKKVFTPAESQGSAYTTMMPAKFFLSGTFDVTKSLNVGGLFFVEQFKDHTATGISASVNKNFGRILSTSLSYTFSNRSYNNLGAGISLNLTPVQVYLVGDNLLGMPISLASTGYMNEFVNSTQVFNLRFGINFVLGWKKDVMPTVADEDKSSFNSKKDKTKPMNEDNSKAYNSRKKGSKSTTDQSKQPQPSVVKSRKKN